MNAFELQEILDSGILSKDILAQLEMAKDKQILASHKYSIWQSESNGCWYTYLPDENEQTRRRLKKRINKEDLEKDIIAYYKEHILDPTINDVFQMWLDQKKENVLSQTVLRYENVYKAYIYSSWFGRMKMKDVTFKHLDRFCSETIGKDKMKAKCWSGIRTNLLGIIRTAKKEGLTALSTSDLKDLDIARNAFKTEVLLPGTDVFTADEANKLMRYIDQHPGDIVLLGVRLLFKTGLRIGELATLKYSDFNFADSVLTVTRTEERIANPDASSKTKTCIVVRERTKGASGWRQIIFDKATENLVRTIHSFNPDEDWLFVSKGERIKANAWTKKLPRTCAKLGIGKQATKIVNGQEELRNYSLKKSPHKVRKNYCSTLLHSGVEPKLVQMQMGHSDIHTTLTYYDRDITGLEDKKTALIPVLDEM